MSRRLVETKDGSHTIYQCELNEHYHSVHGAIRESMHVFIEKGFRFINKKRLNILEIGFGTGLNAFLTCLETRESGYEVNYTGIEKYPLEMQLLEKLNYSDLAGSESNTILSMIHKTKWGISQEIIRGFNLLKQKADFHHYVFKEKYDLIYFDAFAPDKQPDMWSVGNLEKLYLSLDNGGVFVTYSSKGEVNRRLKSVGFTVQKAKGPPGKREMIRAVK